MKIAQIAKPFGLSSFKEDRQSQESRERLELDGLQKKYKKVLQQLGVVDRFIELAEKYIKAYPTPPKSRLNRRRLNVPRTRESAVLVLSDSHVGKKVYKSQTLGFGDYDFSIFAGRLNFLEQRVRSILAEHITPFVDEIVVLLLGDMLDGSLNHPREVISAMTLFDQFYAGSHCFAQAIRNIARDVPRVRIYTAVGNHARFPNQKFVPSEQRYSNIDHFFYAMVKALLANQPNIDFRLDYQPFCYLDVKGTKILGMHGEHLTGGDRQMNIPIHAIARQISGLTQLYESRGQAAPHLWVMGHKHKPIELPTIKGEWLVNGAFTGDDNYALTLATSCEPMQLFFGVHPKYRKTWEYKLKLIHAPARKTLPYQLPSGLAEMLV